LIHKTNNNDIYVDQSLPKACFNKKLYQIAGACGLRGSIEVETAAVRRGDGSIVQDGSCGFAWMVLTNQRKSFSCWIVKTAES